MFTKILENESCPLCGASLEVFTSCNPKEDTISQFFADGDVVKCEECEYKSHMAIDESGDEAISYHVDNSEDFD